MVAQWLARKTQESRAAARDHLKPAPAATAAPKAAAATPRSKSGGGAAVPEKAKVTQAAHQTASGAGADNAQSAQQGINAFVPASAQPGQVATGVSVAVPAGADAAPALASQAVQMKTVSGGVIRGKVYKGKRSGLT